MDAMKSNRVLVVALAGAIGFALSAPGLAAAQGPRVLPGLRGTERDKERQTEGKARVKLAKHESTTGPVKPE